jgi:hypothetical protein
MKHKKEKLTVEGLIQNPKWKTNFPCVCNGQHDFKNCRNCRYTQCENSIPQEPFDVVVSRLDRKTNKTTTETRHVTKITLDIGAHDDVRGWFY